MRETGPVRKDLSDEGAAPYIGQARVFLGMLKQRMASGKLLQGAWTRTLPDGTVINVQSIFGQDKISIAVPTPTPAPESQQQYETPKVEEPVLEPLEVVSYDTKVSSVRIAGTCTGGNNAYHGIVWDGKGSIVHEIGSVGDYESVVPNDITQDGQKVVGYYKDYYNMISPFYWTAHGGMTVLPTMGQTNQSRATGVSGDGSIIVGYADSYANGYSRAWMWTAQKGFTMLSDNPYAGSQATAISPNGRYIVGHANGDGAVWIDGKGPYPIPRPGTQTPVTRSQIQDFYWYPDISGPTDVNDAGIVCGTTNHMGWVACPFKIVSTYYPTHLGYGAGTKTSSGDEYFNDASVPVPSFTYDAVTGAYTVFDGTGAAYAAASTKRNVFAGASWTSTLQTVHHVIYTGWFTNDPADYSSFLQQYRYANQIDDETFLHFETYVSRGWVMEAGVLRGLGDYTTPNDISGDGSIVVGYTGQGGNSMPTAWVGFAPMPLELLPGTDWGEARTVNTVAAPETTVSTQTIGGG